MSTPAQVPQNPQEREVTAGTPSPMERYPEEKNVAMDSPQATRSSNEDWNEQRPDDGVKKPWWNSIFVMGSTTQIIIAALLGIVIGVSVSTNVETVPKQAITILLIPGDLWLRGLKAAVLPLIVTAMIIAVQRLKEETSSKGKKLAWVTVGYYVVTTLIAIGHSTIMVALVWSPMMPIASSDVLQLTEKQKADFKARNERTVDESVQDVFRSFVPDNIVSAMANTELLSVLMTAVVFGALLKPNSAIMKAVVEIERIVMIILTFLIKLAPIGVFFLVMPNLLKLDIAVIGQSLGVLIAGALANMAIHLFFVTSIIYFAVVRKNPYTYFIKCAPAWITGWGTASSAATMPVTMRVAKERGCPETVRRFAIPLGTLINMDGTSIYFPVVVTFLARTQGITLDATQYVLVVLLSTLSAIATTPIPSASLVLTVMICNAVGVPMTGMYGVVVAVDWFLDRFRTALNVLGDLYGVGVITKITKITDDDVPPETIGETVHHTGANAV